MKTIRGQVQIAIERQEAVHFIYVTPEKVSIRLVTPHKFKDAQLFIGEDFGVKGLRSFNLQRIRKLVRINPRDVAVPFKITEIKVSG